MQLPITLSVLILATATSASPDIMGKQAATRAADVEETLIRLEHQISDAQLRRDVAQLQTVMSDDFLVTVSDGRLLTKAEALGTLTSDALEPLCAELSDIKVHVFGDTAVVTYLVDQKVKVQGRELVGRERDTDVFVRRATQWELVASQGTTVRSLRP